VAVRKSDPLSVVYFSSFCATSCLMAQLQDLLFLAFPRQNIGFSSKIASPLLRQRSCAPLILTSPDNPISFDWSSTDCQRTRRGLYRVRGHRLLPSVYHPFEATTLNSTFQLYPPGQSLSMRLQRHDVYQIRTPILILPANPSRREGTPNQFRRRPNIRLSLFFSELQRRCSAGDQPETFFSDMPRSGCFVFRTAGFLFKLIFQHANYTKGG
jgi:hypothetical protein